MGENGLSVADALALQNKNGTTNGDGFLNGGQGAWWVIILILFFAFAGWGNRGVQNGLCDGFYSTSLGISNLGNECY